MITPNALYEELMECRDAGFPSPSSEGKEARFSNSVVGHGYFVSSTSLNGHANITPVGRMRQPDHGRSHRRACALARRDGTGHGTLRNWAAAGGSLLART